MIVKGVYEGGLKIWECSIDLADFLHHAVEVAGTEPASISTTERSTKLIFPHDSSVLELGCGHGLPAITALRKLEAFTSSSSSLRCQSSTSTSQQCSVVFTDFNKEVIEKITWPNILENCISSRTKHNVSGSSSSSSSSSRVRCFHGDWDIFAHYSLLPSATLPKLYGLIVSAETLYTIESCKKVYIMISKFLCLNGLAILASKRYYFGVGGGVYELESIIKARGDSDRFAVVERRSFEDGKSNIRDIVVLKRIF